jgi:GT2 family glycosyltransferase
MIGIVTVLFNSDDVLPGFFASLATQRDVEFRLYVIDNSPTDSGSVLSRQLAERYAIDTVVVFNNNNGGVAKGNNQGIELALNDGCRFVLLANNDTEFSAGTISRLLTPIVGGATRVTTPKIMYFDQSDIFWYGGGRIGAWTLRTPHDGIGEKDVGQFDNVTTVGYAPTCFMMIESGVFAEVGMMDEAYFVYYDDVDFVWRMAKRGLSIGFVAESIVLHKVSRSTGGAFSPFSLRFTNRNRIYFIRKHLVGLQRMFALGYMLCTRIPRLISRPASAVHMWRGVREGFAMKAEPHPK